MESIFVGPAVVKILYISHVKHIKFITQNSLQLRHKTITQKSLIWPWVQSSTKVTNQSTWHNHLSWSNLMPNTKHLHHKTVTAQLESPMQNS